MTIYVGPHKSLISGYGDTLADTLSAMRRGESALRPATWDDGTTFYVQTIKGHDAPRPHLSRLETLGATVLTDCVKGNKWKPENLRHVGVIISTTKGNIRNATTDEPQDGSGVFIYEMARRITHEAGIDAEPVVVCNACISGVAAVIVGSRLIRNGEYDDIFIVGLDESSRFVTSGFLGFRSVSPRPCVPYDSRRDGLSLGEAAGCMLLTNNPGCGGRTVIEGGTLTNDANHISGPSRTGEPLACAMTAAMSQSLREPRRAAFVNAHGTGTVYNDEMEAKAIDLAGLAAAPVNSLKPYLGHTLGASGLIELMVCDDELLSNEIFPTLGFESLGVSKTLQVSGLAQHTVGNFCVKTASGFGGCNAAVVMSKASAAREVAMAHEPQLTTLRTVDIASGHITMDGRNILDDNEERDFDTLVRDAYHNLGQPNMKFFKMDDMSKMGYIGAEYLLADIDADDDVRRNMAILLANKSASLDTDIAYIRQMEIGQASPAKFVYTLPNIVIGEICIRHKIKGESLFVIMPNRDDESLRHFATKALDLSRSKMMICGWCEKLGQSYDLHLELLKTN